MDTGVCTASPTLASKRIPSLESLHIHRMIFQCLEAIGSVPNDHQPLDLTLGCQLIDIFLCCHLFSCHKTMHRTPVCESPLKGTPWSRTFCRHPQSQHPCLHAMGLPKRSPRTFGKGAGPKLNSRSKAGGNSAKLGTRVVHKTQPNRQGCKPLLLWIVAVAAVAVTFASVAIVAAVAVSVAGLVVVVALALVSLVFSSVSESLPCPFPGSSPAGSWAS